MTDQARLKAPVRYGHGRAARKHHWLRWILAGLMALIILIVAAIVAFIKLQPDPSPLALPAAAARAPDGPASGTWDVAAGSLAGFRVRASTLGLGSDVVGRTSAVTGTIVISGDRVAAAAFRVGLAAIRVGGKTETQLARSLGTRQHPAATFILTGPVTLGSGFTTGTTVSMTASGQLSMHGISRPVTVTMSGRRDGADLQVAGSIPVAFSGWHIGGLGSLASRGIAEFLLVLHRQ